MGSTVRGEARLYTGTFDDDTTGFDQVGFEGEAGENTTIWNESYESVAAPWSDDPYEYSNGSADEPSLADRASDGFEIRGVPAVVPGAVVVALLVVVVSIRRRR
jgi:hypothetical protein